MQPVPVEVANHLEAGYQELRPWTETWADELRCAVEVGPLGEEKISYRLWPLEPSKSGKQPLGKRVWNAPVDPFCAARCFRGEAAAEGAQVPPQGGPNNSATSQTPRRFANYHVIFKDARLAFLLKPSLKPSAYYGRRPAAKIIKGSTVGIPVIRGFDVDARDQQGTPKSPASVGISSSPGETAPETADSGPCAACESDKEQARVNDLVLVIHGIGQKFAERVESFHFTHAINAFRRAVNLELKTPVVKAVLREDSTAIMVLPVNWRQSLSFEDGGPMTEADRTAEALAAFGLKDIEPPTIPAVRSMISDVMFDIPFYMSQHKPKMIGALVAEANRIYRLWCQNNPGFADHGRVHLIAHSLGSAMALDILSRQPTYTPKLDPSKTVPATDFFEFDTTNLFLAGSPAAFFLLLERGALLPRRGRLKPGADPHDVTAEDINGEAGSLGCMAVDNIYNILAKEDPIAYLLNGTIDPVYATSLRTAYVPSTTSSLVEMMGNVVRHLVPLKPSKVDLTGVSQVKPPVVRLPSQLELEVHDFTREEVAEKKAYLLNDNAQIDYYLHSGSGPLEIQYLNMLGAHSSYWSHKDFVRMLCVEIGRRPGREYTIPEMRARKIPRQHLETNPS